MTVTVLNITNLPPSRVVLGSSNPYLKLTHNGNTFKSSTRIGNHIPSWSEEPLSIGYASSASDLLIQVWYAQPGFDFVDELIQELHIRVPYCNTLTAKYVATPCPDPLVGCSTHQSSWAMPEEQLCLESDSLSMTTGQGCSSPRDVCISLSIALTPFSLKILKSNMNSTPTITGVAYPVDGLNWTYHFGLPYLDSSSALDLHITESSVLLGALMVQMPDAYKNYGSTNSILFYAAFNFPAVLYVCRNTLDNQNGVPPWILSSFSAQNKTATSLLLQDGITSYNCFYKYEAATLMNEFDYVVQNPIPFYSNVISDIPMGPYFYKDQFIVIISPHVYTSQRQSYAISYSYIPFVESIASYGSAWLWFTFSIYTFLKRIDFRLDRVDNFIRIQGFNKSQMNIFTSLLYYHNMEPIRMKSNLFYATIVIKMILALPLLTLLPWGINCIYKVSPSAIGSLIIFVGSSTLLMCFGLLSWRYNSWRLTSSTISAFLGAAVLSLCFSVCVIFQTSKNEELTVSFTALSLAFCAINTAFYFPYLLADDKFRIYRHQEVRRTLLNLLDKTMELPPPGSNDPEAFLRNVLGWFTINTAKPYFRFSTTFFDPLYPRSFLYTLSVAVFIPYIVITGIFTPYLSLGLLHTVTLLVLDFVGRCFSHPQMEVPLTRQIIVIATGRLLIMGSSEDSWLIFYGIVYALYASLLYLSILVQFLPNLSTKDCSRQLFALLVPKYKLRSEHDISRNPTVSCVILLVYFIWVILLTDLGEGAVSLINPHYQYAIATLAIMVPFIITSFVATLRVLYLESQALVSRSFNKIFVAIKFCNLSTALCFASETLILSTGLIMFGFLNG